MGSKDCFLGNKTKVKNGGKKIREFFILRAHRRKLERFGIVATASYLNIEFAL